MPPQIDLEQTHKNLVQLLSKELRPIQYREAFNRTKVWSQSSKQYSENTDPCEKFRQRYAEHKQTGIDFIAGGYLALSRWYPLHHSPSLFPPQEQVVIEGNTIVSFDAGYEVAKREPFMLNKFNKSPRDWYERRRRGALIEHHIASYFKANYPRFFTEPNNKGQYERPSKEDFVLKTDWARIVVDVKSLGESTDETFVVTNPSSEVGLYIIGDLSEDENQTIITGMMTSDIVKVMGAKNPRIDDMYVVNTNHLWSIEPLLVLLNMADCGINYTEYKRLRKEKVFA